MAKKILTPKEYADIYPCNVSYIHKCIRQQKTLKGVKKINSYGRMYTLEMVKNYESIMQIK